nr:MAG TPA: Morphogenesis protein 1 hydrolase [Bacteriophage sp.]
MEKIMYPLKNMWITCKPGEYAHKYSKAIDDQGFDYKSIDKLYAPYTGKVVRKYPSECEIWFESIDKVEFADGTIDYATILFAHKDRYDDIKEGVVYKQGEVIYSEGTKAGNKVGGAQRHVHFEICAGKTTGSGWKKSPDGTWNLVKGKKPTACYFIDDSINVIKNGGLNFKKIETPKVTQVVDRNENIPQIRVIVDNLRVRTGHSTNSSVLGFVQNKGIYNDLETYNDGTYIWHRIDDGQWIADDGSWLEILTVTDYKKLYESSLNTIESLNKQISTQNDTINNLNEKLNKINELSKI